MSDIEVQLEDGPAGIEPICGKTPDSGRNNNGYSVRTSR